MSVNKVFHGDVCASIKLIEDKSIDVIITSPPYYKQRDYGFAQQIGQEPTPELYIIKLVDLFSAIKDKLSPHGVFFLNIGDKYLSKYGKSHLLQIPYKIAYLMQEKGWYLADILIWYKPNHMPSPVKDRFVNSYEPVFVFALNKENIYISKNQKILNVPLEQTTNKHTAVFPIRLVEELLIRVDLKKVKTILDPFAGTGTTGVPAKQLGKNFILIEFVEHYVDIIKQRLNNVEIVKVEDVSFDDTEAKDNKPDIRIDCSQIIPNYPHFTHINRKGIFHICKDLEEFCQVFEYIKTQEFRNLFDEDALFLIGINSTEVKAMALAGEILKYGYVLRNMLVVEKEDKSWFPIFMFAFDTKKVEYVFNVDIFIRKSRSNGYKEPALYEGMKVICQWSKREGKLIRALNSWTVEVLWNDRERTQEFLIPPMFEERIRNGLKLLCPACKAEISEFPSFELRSDKLYCPSCKLKLFEDLKSIPLIVEPNMAFLQNLPLVLKKSHEKTVNTKYAELDRINWGASPAARSKILGVYLTRTRLYNIRQDIFTSFLKTLIRYMGWNTKTIIQMLGRDYTHKVPHWLRTDFGGSIPTPEDIERLENIVGPYDFLTIAKKTALKLQTVKPRSSGKYPEDVIKYERIKDLISLYA